MADRVLPSPADPLVAMTEQFSGVAQALGEMRLALVDEGFTEEQAGDIVVEVFRQGMRAQSD